MTLPKLAFSIVALTTMIVSSLAACGSGGSAKGFEPGLYDEGGAEASPDANVQGDAAGKPDGGDGDKICLLNNCDTDRECADCGDGKTSCSQKEHRCIACGPNAGGATCQNGDACSKYGACVPAGVACAEDAGGVPTISCGKDADCAACGPKNRICNMGTMKCVGCSDTNVTNCQSTDVCSSGACVAACPLTCTLDADCGKCGAPGKEAHACYNHKCSQCSAKVPCPAGQACNDHGVCKLQCGLVDTTRKESCNVDADCTGCKGGATKCQVPLNGGIGACTTPATGCSDLGKGVVVLPPPANEVTNTCSSDMDCKNVGVQFNVGKAIRDATGLSVVKDANVPYPMHACASIKIVGQSCGVCVPCKKDADCQDIDISKVAGDAFGPLGSVGAALLLDKAFGPNDHKVHMYCEQVAGEYGVCSPCSNILSSCSTGQAPPAGGKCDHDECKDGGPLGTQCSACTAEVCAKDAFCCTDKWDALCTREVEDNCTLKTCAAPDTCAFKTPGFYCSTLQTFSAYECDKNQQIISGSQCAPAEFCHPLAPGPKSKAELDTNGKPKCFTTPP